MHDMTTTEGTGTTMDHSMHMSTTQDAEGTCGLYNGQQMNCEHYHHNNAAAFACVYDADSGTCSATALENGMSMDHSMMMYFHTGMDDILWFENFKPNTTGKYIGACLAILGFAIVREVAVFYRKKIRSSQKQDSILDTLMVGISMLSSYMLMLAFMTYNVGLCMVTIGSFMLTNYVMLQFDVRTVVTEDCCAVDVDFGPRTGGAE